jgi:hypothetical protein
VSGFVVRGETPLVVDCQITVPSGSSRSRQPLVALDKQRTFQMTGHSRERRAGRRP